MGNSFDNGLFLTSQEAEDVRALIEECKAARAERKAKEAEGGWTREKIMAVKNPHDRQELIKKNMHLFKK